MRIAITFKAIHILLALILMEVCSLGVLQRLSCWGAKPPPVAVVHIAEDDELQVASRHKYSLLQRVVVQFSSHQLTRSAKVQKRTATKV